MTQLFDDPATFADDMIDGFVAANSRFVSRVRGGVVRRTATKEPTVAVVIGGGSGHYPAFGGLVGPGLAHGAVLGQIFASPPAQHVEAVSRRCDEGRGILLTYGNYAGDVLNFSAAQQALVADGIDCRTVRVTDDIFSAPSSEIEKRRGIAGDLTVFKIAGAASAEGLSLDEVERLANAANARTRTMGVAFSGCKLPGASDPLFTVAPGTMAIGLGIHGEPGIDAVPVPSAAGLARLFIERLLAEVPDGVSVEGARVVPILNGLGTVKYDELFVVYKTIAIELNKYGIVAVDPQVGEFCTSFDMAGASLTLLWLNDELERLWLAPASSPAFRVGTVAGIETADESETSVAIDELVVASDGARAGAVCAIAALEAIGRVIDENVEELGRLDSVAGDGDHGIGMQRGSQAAIIAGRAAAKRGAGTETTLVRAADAWAERAGGTSGALWAVILTKMATSIGDSSAPTPEAIARGAIAALDAVVNYGKAKVGDKTMVDSLVPFAETLEREVAAGSPLADAWGAAADDASAAAAATAALVPKLGRARAHGHNSVGTPDPGAISLALITQAVHAVLS